MLIRTGRRWASLVSGLAALLPATAGCAVPAGNTGIPGVDVNVAAFDALARQEAAAWAGSSLGKEWATGFVVLDPGSLISGPRNGFPSGAAKMAFINGDLVFTGPPPSGAPAGRVTWPGGASVRVPVLSAAQAFGKLTSSRQCPGCATTPLDVTAARPATLAVATSRGTAEVPAWAFTLKGVSAPVLVAALPPGSYATPGSQGTPSAEELAPLGKDFASVLTATASADGRTLTVQVEGSPCDTTWGGLVYAADGAVVVGGWTHNPDPGQACAAMMVFRPAAVRLAAPVGDRVIINAETGQPFLPEP